MVFNVRSVNTDTIKRVFSFSDGEEEGQAVTHVILLV